jgi:N-acetylglucosaminyldiphosphoundecaprenol N-acetyl-beta-D-mannosaminyltransferase
MAEIPPQEDIRPRRIVELLGAPIDALTMDETVDAVRAMVRIGTPHQHVVVNASKIVLMDRDPFLREVVRGCDLVSADGMSAVWACRWLGSPLPARVTGVDLFARLVAAAHKDGSSVYFLGASDEVVAKVAAYFAALYPGLRVAGSRNGYWDDDDEVVEEVRAATPDYLFLAIPSPRKEFWLNEHLARLNVPFVMGVGGSFDVMAGKVGRAPEWAQNAGLEWAWRLGHEPRRLWRRYLVGNTAFIRLAVNEWKRLKVDRRSALKECNGAVAQRSHLTVLSSSPTDGGPAATAD